MKTKHLFFAAALMGSFASCTNENIISDDMQNVTTGRPVVGNVKLSFSASDAQTRVIYDGGYAWQSTDAIGALLMDNVKPSYAPNAAWEDKYELTKYIHTSFPFTYNADKETWGSETKMLEGNYFFAWPWENYDGERKVKHSLLNQQQTGVTADVRKQSYADNQFFVGYSQILAEKAVEGDVLETVDMTPVLGAIQFQITNIGTKTYHINKVVLSGNENIASAITVDPTMQTDTKDDDFNYKKYLGLDTSDPTYNPIEAIRGVVFDCGTENSAQLIINGTPEERALKSDNGQSKAYVLMMCNPISGITEDSDTKGLKLSIYTDEGMVGNIDLAKIYTSSMEYSVVTTSKVEAIGPNVVNTIGIQVDDNSFTVPTEMKIFNSSDLEQFIKWNDNIAGTREIDAELKDDITLTAEIANMLLNSDNVTLNILGSAGINLDKDVPANFLESNKINIAASVANVTINKSMTLTKKTSPLTQLTVAEGVTLIINSADAELPSTIENNGTIAMGADAVVPGITINNNKGGVITLAQGGDCQATINNEIGASITNNGYMKGVVNKGTVVLGQNTTFYGTNNHADAKITTASGAIVVVTNTAGEIVYVSGAKVTAEGKISTEYKGTSLNADTFKKATIGCDITKLIITGNTTVSGSVTFPEIELRSGSLTFGEGQSLSATKMIVTGPVTNNGTITVGKYTVNNDTHVTSYDGSVKITEEATFTNNGTLIVNGTLENNGKVYNKNIIRTDGGTKTGTGAWYYESVKPTENVPAWSDPTDKQQVALDAAVAFWADGWGDTSWYPTYYDGNPYDYDKFAALIKLFTNNKVYTDLVAAYGTTDIFKTNAAGTYVNKPTVKFEQAVDNFLKGKFNSTDEKTRLEMAKAKLLKTDGTWGLTTSWAVSNTVYENKDKAIEAMCYSFTRDYNWSHWSTYTQGNVASQNVPAQMAACLWYKDATEDVKVAAFAALDAFGLKNGDKVHYYIWKGTDACPLYKLADVYNTYVDAATNADVSPTCMRGDASTQTAKNLCNWAEKVVAKNSNGVPALEDAQDALEEIGFSVSNKGTFMSYSSLQLQSVFNDLKFNN